MDTSEELMTALSGAQSDAVAGSATWPANPDAVAGSATWLANPDAVAGSASWLATPQTFVTAPRDDVSGVVDLVTRGL